MNIVQSSIYEEQILTAARQVFVEKKSYKDVCLAMKINLDANGEYLRSTGHDYKRIQSAVRTLCRQRRNRKLRSLTPEARQGRNKITKTQKVDAHINM